jgi:hypothetical protein
MTSSPNTGPTVPAWIREQIDVHERSWPLAALGVGIGMSIVLDAGLGALIWTANSVIYYARP